MQTCTDSDLREHLRERLDEIHTSREPLLVTRANGTAAVILDQQEYDGLMETLHLLRSPANAERLLRGIADADAGRVIPYEDIRRWLLSWGTENELPPPECA